MNKAFKKTSQFCDLIYKDRPYDKEIFQVKKFFPNDSSNLKILVIACGTGNHTKYLKEQYPYAFITSFDQSEEIITYAKEKFINGEINFVHSDISSCKVKNKYDLIICLFHVFSYLTKEKELTDFFSLIKSHSGNEVIIIFDFCYGPAVLNQLLKVKNDIFKDENFVIEKITSPTIYLKVNNVGVNYSYKVTSLADSFISHFTELH
jgi:SAM-dependent methyltransferase